MTTNSKPERSGRANDEESEAIVFQGASMSQICAIFSMDARDVKTKLAGQVKPCDTRRGFPVYRIKDVAPYLVSPPYDLDEFIQRMSIADLPPILRKEFWAGLRSRQLYEKEGAELWPTADVIELVSTMMKTIRMSMLIARESVERETELTPRQRAIITRIIDNTLEETHAATTRKLTEAKSRTAELQDTEASDTEVL